MITFVTFKWEPFDGKLHPKKGIQFTAQHVNVLYSMLARNIKAQEWRLICVTDNSSGIRSEVEILPLWTDYRAMGGCYTRLKLFSAEMKDLIGPDFFAIDLDTVVVSDITHLLEDSRNNYEFRIWGDTNPLTPYNGSFFYLKSGTRRRVWEEFHPIQTPRLASHRRYCGTDQACIGYILGENEARYNCSDGIFSYRVHFQQQKRFDLQGPEKIIFFHGSHDPSKEETQTLSPWVKEHWR